MSVEEIMALYDAHNIGDLASECKLADFPGAQPFHVVNAHQVICIALPWVKH